MVRGSYEPNRDEQTPAAGNGTKDPLLSNKDGAKVGVVREEEIHELSPLRPLDERGEWRFDAHRKWPFFNGWLSLSAFCVKEMTWTNCIRC